MIDCMCLAGLIVIFVGIIVVLRRRPSKDSKADSADLVNIVKSAPILSEKEGILDIKMPSDPQMALAHGRHLLVQGKRAEGVALLIHTLREGPPDVSQAASRMLEELGEIEVF